MRSTRPAPLSRNDELIMQSMFISSGRMTVISADETKRIIQTRIEKIKTSQSRLLTKGHMNYFALVFFFLGGF